MVASLTNKSGFSSKLRSFSQGRCRSVSRTACTSCIALTPVAVVTAPFSLHLGCGFTRMLLFRCWWQVAYYGLLQLFLTRRAVYLLVWDASQAGNETCVSSTTGDLQTLGILPWLAALSFRLPGGEVILVGNKCDLRSGALGSAADAASRVESACSGWLARVRSSGGRAVEIEQGTSLTSCARPGWWAYIKSSTLRGLARISGYKMGWPCDWSAGAIGENRPPSLVDRIVRAGNNGRLRAEEMVLPQSWALALEFLRDLSDNERCGFRASWAQIRTFFCVAHTFLKRASVPAHYFLRAFLRRRACGVPTAQTVGVRWIYSCPT